MSYKFNWDAFVTDTLLDSIAQVAGTTREIAERQRSLIVEILRSVGGLPVSERIFDPTERTAIATKLLHEAIRHVVSGILPSPRKTNCLRYGRSNLPELGAVGSISARVNLNTATAETIADLPVLGPVTAQRIVAERIKRGPFTTLSDVDRRVKGVGPDAIERIAALVTVIDPLASFAPAWSAGPFETDFARLLSQAVQSDAEARLAAMLEAVAMKCAEEPHPATRHGLSRDFAPITIESGAGSNWVSMLAGETYFERLPALFATASQSIDVCMFHIAFPSQQHPSRIVLESLRDARVRGVTVRVLVDRDRANDPYHSTVINSAAKQFFADNGIDCRFDSEDRLLHSKWLVIDDALAVIGSHNWSAGSYFEFDDLSLVIHSETFNAALRTRFETLWPAV